jgi:hypothetical protein
MNMENSVDEYVETDSGGGSTFRSLAQEEQNGSTGQSLCTLWTKTMFGARRNIDGANGRRILNITRVW